MVDLVNNYLLCSIDMTNKCNLSCPYCYKETVYFSTQGSRDEYVDLKKPWLSNFCNWVLTSEIKTDVCFEFHGGEPLIKWDLITSIVKEIESIKSNKNISFGIQTNGLLLTPEKVDWLFDHNVVAGISLDGTKEQHDKNRPILNGKGSYDKIEANIGYLLKKFPATACQVTVVDPNSMVDSLENVVRLGFKNMIFLPLQGAESESPTWQANMVENHLRLAERVVALNKAGYNIVEKSIARPIRAFALGTSGYMCNAWPCGAGTQLIAMDLNGDLYPCDTFFDLKEWSYGNVEDLMITPFDEVIRSSKQVKTLSERHSGNNTSCQTCSVQSSCGGGCPGVTMRRKKTINSPDVHCNYLHGFHSGLDKMLTQEPINAVYLMNATDILNE